MGDICESKFIMENFNQRGSLGSFLLLMITGLTLNWDELWFHMSHVGTTVQVPPLRDILKSTARAYLDLVGRNDLHAVLLYCKSHFRL